MELCSFGGGWGRGIMQQEPGCASNFVKNWDQKNKKTCLGIFAPTSFFSGITVQLLEMQLFEFGLRNNFHSAPMIKRPKAGHYCSFKAKVPDRNPVPFDFVFPPQEGGGAAGPWQWRFSDSLLFPSARKTLCGWWLWRLACSELHGDVWPG